MTNTKQTLGKVPFIIFLGLISSGGPIATDIFLPSLPEMPAYFGVSAAAANLILTAYFFSQAVGILLVGPFSDRHGRKKPLGACLAMYIIGGLICALGNSVWVVIAARVLAGFGGGGLMALSMALVKECFDGETRQNSLLAVSAITTCAPLVAPLLGAAILAFADWRGTFTAQAIIGLAALPFYLRINETLAPEDRTTGSALSTFKGMGSMLKSGPLMLMVITTSLCALGVLAYVTSASYIYIDLFQLPQIGYSIFFSINALMGVVFTVLAPKVLKKVSAQNLVTASYILTTLGGLTCFFVGGLSPFVFLGCTLLIVSINGATRPVAVNLALDMHDGDTGSLSSLINFTFTMMGCLGSLLISLPWPNYIFGLGVMAATASGVALVLWTIMRKAKHI